MPPGGTWARGTFTSSRGAGGGGGGGGVTTGGGVGVRGPPPPPHDHALMTASASKTVRTAHRESETFRYCNIPMLLHGAARFRNTRACSNGGLQEAYVPASLH